MSNYLYVKIGAVQLGTQNFVYRKKMFIKLIYSNLIYKNLVSILITLSIKKKKKERIVYEKVNLEISIKY